MNIEKIDNFLLESLPRYFLTLSSSAPYYVKLVDKKITLDTNRKCFYIDLDDLYELLFDVISLKSFEIQRFKNNHKHVAYLLPIVRFIVVKLDLGLEEYIPPKGGWRKEKSQDQIVEIRNEAKVLDKSAKELNSEVTEPLLESTRSIDNENVVVDVHYATNRKPSCEVEKFSNRKDSKLNYGVARVSIPKNHHKSGLIERPSIFNFTFRENKNKHFVLDSGKTLEEVELFEELKHTSNGKGLMIFVHGYNVSFKNAVFKSAQLKYDLNYEWPVLLFSWPSHENLRSYLSDQNRARQSAPKLRYVLEKISELGIDEVIVIGHSMGTFCLALALELYSSVNKPFKRLALAAADIEKEEFLDVYADKVKEFFGEISLYSSSSDKALIGSKFFNEAARLGDVQNDILVVDGIESIDMTGADDHLFSLRHSYISDSNKALDDLHGFLVNGLSADKRRLKRLLNSQLRRYWAIHKS